MNRQSSEGRQSASTRSPAEQPRQTETGKTNSYRSTEVDKTAVLKKQPPIPRKPARNAPVKVFTREAAPGQSIVQRTDPGNERETTMNKMKSPKHMRVVASLLNMSDQQSSDGDNIKPGTAAEREESRGSQRKQSGTFNRRVEIYSRSKNGTPNSYTPINIDKNKTEISDAIFERDEVDEEDHKDTHQPSQNVSTEEKRASSTDHTILAQQEYFNHEPLMMRRGVSDSPGLKKEIGYNGIYKFPESMADSGISGMNKSNEGSLPGTRSATNVRGAFMNEHITLTELEKQKEKQRKMREALDSQLNEKKQKLQEEKMKQDELNKREEMRIKREVEQLKTLHDKETAYENLRKAHTKTEESDLAFHNRNIVKPASAMQIEVHEKTYTESDALNISTNNANLSFQPTNEKLIITPVRVRGKTESKASNKDLFEPKSHGSPAKINSDVHTLVDENKKLRDENTKKEELIDALIMALKNKEGNAAVAAAAQNLQDKTNLYNTPKKETATPPPVLASKPTKTVNSGEVESDFYGYYLNGYMQPKQKFQASSEQPSAANHTRFDAKDLSYSITEEKNFSLNNYDKHDMKDFKPKVIRKAIPDYMMDSSSAVQSQSTTPYYRLAMGNNHSLSGLFGNARGYSSPLAGNLNKSVFTPSQKLDGKNSPYMPLIASNSGNLSVSLEPMKSVSQGNLIAKSHIVPAEMVLNPSGSSLFRMKKRQDHSMDVMENQHELVLDRKQPSERPAINIIDEDGSYAVTKPNPMPRREYNDLIHPYSSPNYGIHDYKKLELIDTSSYHEKPAMKAHSMSVNPSPHDTPTELNSSYQMKLFGKIALYGSGGGAFEKRVMSEDMGKEKWVLADNTLIRKTRKEEMFEKSKGLPPMESKSKFPKEVFPSNLKKKICH